MPPCGCGFVVKRDTTDLSVFASAKHHLKTCVNLNKRAIHHIGDFFGQRHFADVLSVLQLGHQNDVK